MSDINRYTANQRRIARTRNKLKGTSDRPRFAVRISNRHVSAQIIDDSNGVTLVAADSKALKVTKTEDATAAVGKDIATKAMKAKITRVVFDRGAKQYHGRIQQVADAARQAGLEL